MTTDSLPPSIGEVWAVVEPDRKEQTARLYGYSAQTSLHLLERLHRVTEGPIVLDFPVGVPADTAAVRREASDGTTWETFEGEPVGDAWYFTPAAMEMACYLTGWAVEPVAPGKLRLTLP